MSGLLVVMAHPDDESMSTGGLIEQGYGREPYIAQSQIAPPLTSGGLLGEFALATPSARPCAKSWRASGWRFGRWHGL